MNSVIMKASWIWSSGWVVSSISRCVLGNCSNFTSPYVFLLLESIFIFPVIVCWNAMSSYSSLPSSSFVPSLINNQLASAFINGFIYSLLVLSSASKLLIWANFFRHPIISLWCSVGVSGKGKNVYLLSLFSFFISQPY